MIETYGHIVELVFGVTSKKQHIDQWLGCGDNLNKQSKPDGKTLLHEAVSRELEEVINFLLDIGVDTNIMDRNKITPLMIATEKGNLHVIEMLLEEGADPRALCEEGKKASDYCQDKTINALLTAHSKQTPEQCELLTACKKGDLATVKWQYSKRTKHISDNKGNWLLIIATKGKHQEIVKYLLDEGANPNQVNHAGKTAIMIACKQKDLDICQLLIDNKALLCIREQKDGQFALSFAVSGNAPGILKQLLSSNSAIVNQANFSGRTALHCACAEGYLECVNILLEYRANVDLPDCKGYTPVMIAASESYETIVKLLCEEGCDVSIKNSEGNTALDVSKNNEVKSLILQRGSNRAMEKGKFFTYLKTSYGAQEGTSNCFPVIFFILLP